MELTEATIDSAKPRAKPYKLFDAGGLHILVSVHGGKAWRLKYRFGGKEKQLSLGRYPAVTIAEARDRRDAFREMLADGIDPSEQARAMRAAQLDESARQNALMRFLLDNDGALAIRLGNRRFTLSPTETGELRAFLHATRAVTPKVTSCP